MVFALPRLSVDNSDRTHFASLVFAHRMGIVTKEQLRASADRRIMDLEKPEYWLIEVSMEGYCKDLERLIEEVDDAVFTETLRFAYQAWIGHRISDEQFASCCRTLATQSIYQWQSELMSFIDYEFEFYDDELFRTKEEIALRVKNAVEIVLDAAHNDQSPDSSLSAPTFRVRLLFEWGGGSLWAGNDATRAKYGVGPIEDALPISPQTHDKLDELSAWHDNALDWNYPPDPSPWSKEERERFDAAALKLLDSIRKELGTQYEVVYEPL